MNIEEDVPGVKGIGPRYFTAGSVLSHSGGVMNAPMLLDVLATDRL